MFELHAHKSDSYGPRTYLNAGFADVTLAFASNFNTAGEILTEKAAKGRIVQVALEKPLDAKKAARTIFHYMKQYQCKTVNIAGNGIYTLDKDGYTQEEINQYIYEVLALLHTHIGIEKIRSGGQTGVDIAGAVAAYVLQIPAIITYPRGFRQRLKDGSDIIQDETAALDTIVRYSESLELTKE